MTNAATIKQAFPQIPLALFMHENQLGYPGSELPNKFAEINWNSLKAADLVMFNSEFHLKQLLELLPNLGASKQDLRQLANESSVVYVGIEPGLTELPNNRGEIPLVLFNQRWEQDKRPDLFLEACTELANQDVEFNLALCGEHYPGRYEIPSSLTSQVTYEGYLGRGTYLDVLSRSDIVVSTAEHEYFGVAVAEAIAAGAVPCLPNRLSYPELVPETSNLALYENRFTQALSYQLKNLSRQDPTQTRLTRAHMKNFGWPAISDSYDAELKALFNGHQ